MFESEAAIHAVVKAMVDISILFKLDGWFLNVENKIEDPAKLKYFVKTLTEEVHKRKPGSLVIWYDSVIETGALAWQNELNSLNRCHTNYLTIFNLYKIFKCQMLFRSLRWNIYQLHVERNKHVKLFGCC